MSSKIDSLAQGIKSFDESTAQALIDSSYQYLVNPASVPLKKISLQFRPLFSSIYDFLNKASSFQIKSLDDQLEKRGIKSKTIRSALIQKIQRLKSVQREKIILSGFYAKQLPKGARPPNLDPINQRKQNIAMKRLSQKSLIEGINSIKEYKGIKWSLSVVLSTSRLNKVLKPQIKLQIIDQQGKTTDFFISVDKFQELRRQGAVVVKCLQQIEQIKYLK